MQLKRKVFIRVPLYSPSHRRLCVCFVVERGAHLCNIQLKSWLIIILNLIVQVAGVEPTARDVLLEKEFVIAISAPPVAIGLPKLSAVRSVSTAARSPVLIAGGCAPPWLPSATSAFSST